jgi:predicted ATP-dependent endonuclease of OLD family
MKLASAQVTNYRCIDDSNEFTLDQVTCLVGKNEAGKTALLKAFYSLKPWDNDSNPYERVRDYPRRHLNDYEERHPDKPPVVIRTAWNLETHDKAALAAVLGPVGNEMASAVVSRNYQGERIWEFTLDEAKVVSHVITSAGLHKEEIADLGTHTSIESLKVAMGAVASPSERHTRLSEALARDFAAGTARAATIAVLEKQLPSFVYFAQYDRMQGQVSLEQIISKKERNDPEPLSRDDRVFLAFCALVNTPVEEIAKLTEFEAMDAKFNAASIKITKTLFAYWTQNRHLKVRFRLDAARPGDKAPFNSGNVLRTRIHNTHHDMEIGFDDRSTGFVWFFSFLVLFSQIQKTLGKNVILLLDEPALSLHAKAQSDLLQYFKKELAPNYQVLYTTHSPFLVPPDNLLSVRTIEDVVIERPNEMIEVLGTKVGDRVLSRDRDTLFPLQGALGFEITQTLFVGKHTLLVEGPSDLLYLKIASDELKRRGRTFLDPRWVVAPTGGASKVSAFVTLFSANDLNIVAILDYAKGDKKAIEDLRNSELLKDGRVLTYDHYAKQPEADVEDIIGARNYVELVNLTYGVKGPELMQIPTKSPCRILKEAEDHFRTVKPPVPEFDHYAPSRYFCEHQSEVLAAMPEADVMLDRFEAIFKDLNPMITT